MKAYSLFLSALLCVFLSTSCASDSDEVAPPVANANAALVVPQDKTIEIEIMELINAYRIENGLSTLNESDVVKSQAFSHTGYMVQVNTVSHANFHSRKNFLVNNASAVKVSENVAYGYSSAQAVVNAWLDSASHKDNIEGDFTHFDISAEQNADGRWYFTNIFIKK